MSGGGRFTAPLRSRPVVGKLCRLGHDIATIRQYREGLLPVDPLITRAHAPPDFVLNF